MNDETITELKQYVLSEEGRSDHIRQVLLRGTAAHLYAGQPAVATQYANAQKLKF